MKQRLSILLIFILFVFPFTYSQTIYNVESVPNDHLLDASDYVTNPDGIISANVEQEINLRIGAIERYSSAEIAVVLLSSVGYEDIDDFATRLFTYWGIGKNNDNGLLFLLIYDQREMVFRTGYGLEGVLPDIILSRIIRNEISPRLREGNFDAGISAGILKVCDYLENPDTVQEILQSEKDRQAKLAEEQAAFNKKILRGYFFISLLIFLGFSIFLTSKSRTNLPQNLKYKELNGGRGAVVLFTIIFPALMIFFAIFYFITLKRIRNKALICPECNNKMKKLSEKEEDPYLNQAQIIEEDIKSIDYDVWLCPNDGHMEILPYDNTKSMYTLCPNCHAKTYYLQNDVVVRAATSFSRGKGERIYTCKNCGKRDIKPYIIPLIILSSSSGRGSGGSFGGGSFGGGGSWGGGRTGGGGARGGW